MGVPAFFRWLSRKYKSLITFAHEEKAREVNGIKVPIDTSLPNPNNTEFDCLYLDMNGIIHPCCHPEDKPAPKNEDEMMVSIFEMLDTMFNIVRPRKVIYMAIDGVAPRAKMNQQRSRRFRSSKEAHEKIELMSEMRGKLSAQGCILPPEKGKGEHFDSNCITPGTEFMFRLAECLRYYCLHRLQNDPGWANVQCYLSDANVPGEGEHKIMDFIRRQRQSPDYEPNTHHCLCGADADLIMLGLATHEPHFTIIREEFKQTQPGERPCDLCGQLGHEMTMCRGLPKDEVVVEGVGAKISVEQKYIFVRLCVLREYLEEELSTLRVVLGAEYDLERAIDDWVFLCFFVGNDFLAHLPSLEIREGAIDRLVRIYKDTVDKTRGYLCKDGFPDLKKVQIIMIELGKAEDEIFKARYEKEQMFRRRDKEKKKRQKVDNTPHWTPNRSGNSNVYNNFNEPVKIQDVKKGDTKNPMEGYLAANRDGNVALKVEGASSTATDIAISQARKDVGDSNPAKRPAEDEDSDEEPADDVRLHEDGWRDRYYLTKFKVSPEDKDFVNKVVAAYVTGLCWVLRYYYQGCVSWNWYFPFHYAPFASDFRGIVEMFKAFPLDTKPFQPMEQLMGVFPAGSKKFLPNQWAELMYQPDSPIIDFYPSDFKIDLNGKKYAWQGVALLPFVDESRLLGSLKEVYPTLTTREAKRNSQGFERLFVSSKHPWYEGLVALYEYPDSTDYIELDPSKGRGTTGSVKPDDEVVLPGNEVPSPVPSLPAFHNKGAIGVGYLNPQFPVGHIFPAKLLPNVTMPEKTVKPKDYSNNKPGGYRPYTGFNRARPMQGPNTVGNRMLHHMVQGGNRGGYDPRGGYNPRGGGPRGPPPRQAYQYNPNAQSNNYTNNDRGRGQQQRRPYNPYRR